MIWRWPAFKRTRLASPSGRRRSPATILPAACSSSLKRLCPCTRASGAAWHARLHAPIALDEDSEPEPDVAIVAGKALDYLDGHPSSAALVVEVADSSLRLDRRLKSGLYARAGLAEYWIVNLV